jgi:cytochrome c oxidase subunit 2
VIATLGATARLAAQAIATAPQSTLRPGGPDAERIGDLWDVMLVASSVITALVFVALAWALFRRRRPDDVPEADRPADPAGEACNVESGGRGLADRWLPPSERRGVRFMVVAGIIFPAAVLAVLLVFTLRVTTAVSLPSRAVGTTNARPAPGELLIDVIGHQYWWRVRYVDADSTRDFETANELRIPVGQRATIRLTSADVIHSFWVPGLHGKMDLVPGRVNAIPLEAGWPGVWRGQCAEFCGVQHALMAFTVVAEPRERFEAWVAAQRTLAAPPNDSIGTAGQAVFLASGCPQCHTIRGTAARGELGPDLTHVASRLTIAAATYPNAPGYLYGWIAHPQAIKRGNKMPRVPLQPNELHAIVSYLRALP